MKSRLSWLHCSQLATSKLCGIAFKAHKITIMKEPTNMGITYTIINSKPQEIYSTDLCVQKPSATLNS